MITPEVVTMSSQKASSLQRLWLVVLPSILAIPAVQMLIEVATTEWSKKFYHSLMHTSGEFGVRMLIVSLVATPILRAWPGSSIGRWLRRHRRTFGVAAFLYGALHFTFYALNETPSDILGDIPSFFYAAGWIALLLMLPLALTSTKGWQRRLRKRWVKLHRAAYLVAIAVAVHWMLKKGSPVSPPILIHFLPLLLLQANRYRLAVRRRKKT
jgi:sulfoxide reductase heme-binding subunit YedZ